MTEETQNQKIVTEETKNKKTEIWPIFLIIVIALIAGFLIYSEYAKYTQRIKEMQSIPSLPSEGQIISEGTKGDTTQEILEDIDKINIEDLDQQFKEIDSNVNSL